MLLMSESAFARSSEMERGALPPERGTWVTFRAVLTGQQVQPYFDHDREPPGGAGGFQPADWAEELRRYPRSSVPAWWQDRLP